MKSSPARIGRILAATAVTGAAALALAAVPAAQAATSPGTTVVHGLRATPAIHLPSTHLPHLTPEAEAVSSNWSGYAAVAKTGDTIRYAVTSFNIPSVNCSKSPPGTSGYAYAAHWVGLDGYNDSTVEQTGVDAYCPSTSGPAGYYAWYEMYPLDPVAFSGVNPGDAITVSVSYSGGKYNLILKDTTTGGEINTTQPCPAGSKCKNKSAEVITEDPGGAVPAYNLADYANVNYTNTGVTSSSGLRGTLGASAQWTSAEIAMEDPSSVIMAQPSGLEGGAAFDDLWKKAS